MILVKGLHRRGHEPLLSKWLPEDYNPFRAEPDRDVVRVWDTETRQEVHSFDDCREAWFSPDGKVLATLRDGNAIDLWKVPFRPSHWRILGWTVMVWLVVVSAYWLGVKTRRMLVSRRH